MAKPTILSETKLSKNETWTRYGLLTITGLSVAIGILVMKYHPPESKNVLKREPSAGMDVASVKIGGTSPFTPKEIIEIKLADYHQSVDLLHARIYWQAGLALMCLLLIGRYSRDVDLPILGVKFPSRLLLTLVPLLMFYLWLQFGYELNSCIEKRLALVLNFQDMGDWPSKADVENVDNEGYANLNFQKSSLVTSLSDSGFMDGWFVCNWPKYSIQGHGDINQFLFNFGYGLILGLFHACMLVTFLGGIYEIESSTSRRFAWSLFVIVFLVLFLSYAQFVWHAKNPSQLQYWIWVFTFVNLWWLLIYESRSRMKAKITRLNPAI
jgi:hypothetical protein